MLTVVLPQYSNKAKYLEDNSAIVEIITFSELCFCLKVEDLLDLEILL